MSTRVGLFHAKRLVSRVYCLCLRLWSCFIQVVFAYIPIEYEYFLNTYSATDETVTGIITPGQSGSWNNGNERIRHTLQIARTGASSSDKILCHTQDIHFGSLEYVDCIPCRGCMIGGCYPSAGDTVNVFLAPLTTEFCPLKCYLMKSAKKCSLSHFGFCFFIFFLHIVMRASRRTLRRRKSQTSV